MQILAFVVMDRSTLYVGLAFIVVVLAAVVIFGLKRGNVFGKFKLPGGIEGTLDASMPPAVTMKDASAGGNIKLLDKTQRGVRGESLTAKGDITAESSSPQDKSPKD
jgi:hypothetical protein